MADHPGNSQPPASPAPSATGLEDMLVSFTPLADYVQRPKSRVKIRIGDINVDAPITDAHTFARDIEAELRRAYKASGILEDLLPYATNPPQEVSIQVPRIDITSESATAAGVADDIMCHMREELAERHCRLHGGWRPGLAAAGKTDAVAQWSSLTGADAPPVVPYWCGLSAAPYAPPGVMPFAARIHGREQGGTTPRYGYYEPSEPVAPPLARCHEPYEPPVAPPPLASCHKPHERLPQIVFEYKEKSVLERVRNAWAFTEGAWQGLADAARQDGEEAIKSLEAVSPELFKELLKGFAALAFDCLQYVAYKIDGEWGKEGHARIAAIGEDINLLVRRILDDPLSPFREKAEELKAQFEEFLSLLEQDRHEEAGKLFGPLVWNIALMIIGGKVAKNGLKILDKLPVVKKAQAAVLSARKATPRKTKARIKRRRAYARPQSRRKKPRQGRMTQAEVERIKAAGGRVIFSVKGFGLTKADLDLMVESGNFMARGGKLTQAGRGLQKHGVGRLGLSTFPYATGSPEKFNELGAKILSDILHHRRALVKPGNSYGGIDIYSPKGIGARFNEHNHFIGFLEP